MSEKELSSGSYCWGYHGYGKVRKLLNFIEKEQSLIQLKLRYFRQKRSAGKDSTI